MATCKQCKDLGTYFTGRRIRVQQFCECQTGKELQGKHDRLLSKAYESFCYAVENDTLMEQPPARKE